MVFELTEFANNTLVERLQTIPGVSSIRVMGEKRYAMRIWLDPAKLSAYSLTPLDVQIALNRENVELPSGKIAGNSTELTVRTFGKLYSEEDFQNVIVKSTPTGNIRLRDVGEAVLGSRKRRVSFTREQYPYGWVGYKSIAWSKLCRNLG